MEQKNYIINLLNIQDKYLILNKIEFINNTYSIYLSKLKNESASCPKCGGVSNRNNSYYSRTIKVNPIDGYQTFIILKQILLLLILLLTKDYQMVLLKEKIIFAKQ